MTTLFVSDLHLDTERPRILALFETFLETEAVHAGALYILGDLFEAWVGDDDDSPTAERVTGALRAFSGSGVPLYVMRGNRDFLFGRHFEQRTGCRLLDDPTVVELDGERVLLMHGDSLCTDDVAYQQWRAQARAPEWQRYFLGLPLAKRRELADRARVESRDHTAQSDEVIMDVNPGAVIETMRRFGVNRLIHGHTHRPDVHRWRQDEAGAERIVLGDWYEQGSVLRVRDGRYALSALPV